MQVTSINSVSKRTQALRYLVLAAALGMFLLIVAGGVVRATASGGACPDWPTCLGQWTPPAGEAARLDYAHRLLALLVTPLVLGSAAAAWLTQRRERWVSRLLLAALGLLGVQIALGAALGLGWLPAAQHWAAALHLGLSLLALGALLVAAVATFYPRAQAGQALRLVFQSPFARLSLVTLAVLFALLVSGAVVAGSQAGSACAGWPLCAPVTWMDWINLGHRGVVALSGLLMAAWFVQAWRTQRSQTATLTATAAAGVLFVSQALLGGRLVQGFPLYLLALHQATAVAVWAAAVVAVTAAGMAGRTAEEERAEAAGFAGRKGLLKDFLLLTKPIVVALLLVTTLAGMVIGLRAWPPLPVVFWTLLSGFMAAGGSGAINQYIDRYDDEKMQRTQQRPIPAGRLAAGEGLAFGVAMAITAFYLMVAFVNFLAALLVLAGTIYYVLLYSIFLKKTTVQNIVIGGGAGAIPPLVGWAAATGSLNIPSLFLFAVVFMWTPPHFWALAIVRRKDYARAGVPMLPVVRGEQEARAQIFIYTVELVAVTLLMPLFGLGGGLYLVLAALLGAWLLWAAWKVRQEGGNKVAWKMYRYSSMYLAFLFFALMIDRLR